MSATPARRQPITDTIPALAGAGIDHVVASAELGIGLQVSKPFTLTGADQAITFAELESQGGNRMKEPIDTDYVVLVAGDSTAKVDLESVTREGFTLAGGANTDVVAFVVFGRFGALKR